MKGVDVLVKSDEVGEWDPQGDTSTIAVTRCRKLISVLLDF